MIREPNGGNYRKGKALTYQGVLDEIASNLENANAWAVHKNWSNAAKYSLKAEALIELLEVHNCGSIGGFDNGQKPNSTLEERWEWLDGGNPN
jgi:hypothetical protein